MARAQAGRPARTTLGLYHIPEFLSRVLLNFRFYTVPDVGIPFGANRHIGDGRADQLFQVPDVDDGLNRQICECPATGDVTVPAVHVFIYRFCAPQGGRCREIRDTLPVHFVGDTDGDLRQEGYRIQLGQCNGINALKADAVAGRDRVKTADTAGK